MIRLLREGADIAGYVGLVGLLVALFALAGYLLSTAPAVIP